MIIGHGDIAGVIKDMADKLYFASGVSNSQETRESEYQREIELLLSQDRNLHIVYIGSLAIFYSDTRYTQHKKLMESFVKQFEHYAIVRIGNITWGKNPHTIINYLRSQNELGLPLKIRNEYRYVVEKEEFLHWIDLVPKWNCEMNITGERLSIKQIVEKYCGGWNSASK